MKKNIDDGIVFRNDLLVACVDVPVCVDGVYVDSTVPLDAVNKRH